MDVRSLEASVKTHMRRTMGNLEAQAIFTPQSPSVGRVVHYVAYGTPGGEFPEGVCRAAVITEVGKLGDAEVVGLCVLNPTGQFFNRNMLYSKIKSPGTWHWPERV
jgi:hypothetical protein